AAAIGSCVPLVETNRPGVLCDSAVVIALSPVGTAAVAESPLVTGVNFKRRVVVANGVIVIAICQMSIAASIVGICRSRVEFYDYIIIFDRVSKVAPFRVYVGSAEKGPLELGIYFDGPTILNDCAVVIVLRCVSIREISVRVSILGVQF